MIYHATVTASESTTQFLYEDCGHYEKFDSHGSVELKSPTTCKVSNIPELAASKRPAGAVMAVVKNLINDYGDPHEIEFADEVVVYEIDVDPDIDCSKSTFGDFTVLEEVRVRDKQKFPLDGSAIYSIHIPKQLFVDVDLMYLPQMFLESTSVLDEWGVAVRNGVTQLLQNGSYPSIEQKYSVERPDAEAYPENRRR